MKTLFGVGPIIISREVNGELIQCTYDYYIKGNMSFILDIKNSGKKSLGGDDLSYIKGGYMAFDLVLSDTKVLGNDGDNLINLLNIINDCIAADRTDQHIDIVPAFSSQTSQSYRCKIVGKNIDIKDAGNKGNGQIINLKLQIVQRQLAIPISYYESEDTVTGFVENEMKDLYEA